MGEYGTVARIGQRPPPRYRRPAGGGERTLAEVMACLHHLARLRDRGLEPA